MKLSSQFIFGLLVVIFLVGFLSWSYFQPAKQAPVQAVENLGQYEPQGGGFGEVRCDRIIPIGEPLEATVNLMAQILTEQQNAGGYVKSASGNLQNIFAQLSKDQKFVCDFRNCLPVSVDLGPKFVLDIDVLVKTITLVGHAPIPADKDCAGSPCPDLGDEKTGPIGALTGWLAAIEESRNRVKAIFEDPTVTVNEDIAQLTPVDPKDLSKGYTTDLGQKITQQEAIRRKAAKAAVMVKECSLSDVEKKMVLSGRLGNKYPMTCKDAIDAGQYWPMPWSESCKTECADGSGSDDCIKCLQTKTPDLKKASILGRLNYKIYHTCTKKCQDQNSGDWGLSDACLECLCTNFTIVPNTDILSLRAVDIIETKLSDNECMAFLCGGSKYNWTCCHQAPIEFFGDTDPWGGPAIKFSETKIDKTELPDMFKITAYSPKADCRGECVSTAKRGKLPAGQGDLGVNFGIIAVSYKNDKHGNITSAAIQPGSRVKIKRLGDANGSEISEWKKEIQTESSSGGKKNINFIDDYEFCACDKIGQFCDASGRAQSDNKVSCIDNNVQWIDIWLPTWAQADEWGAKWGTLEVSYDPKDNCCEELRDTKKSCLLGSKVPEPKSNSCAVVGW